MNHDLLKNIIYDQHELIQNADIVARPSYSFEPNANYVLVGLRRAGKSTLLFKIVQDLVAKGVTWEQIIYINFEDERLSEFQKEDFNDILSVQSELSAERGYFFFDEIQIVPGWEKFCRRMADAKEHVYVTGSNASMLSREISTTLGGRYLTNLPGGTGLGLESIQATAEKYHGTARFHHEGKIFSTDIRIPLDLEK